MAARNTMNIMIIALLSVLVLALIFLLVIQNQALEKANINKDNAEKKAKIEKDKRTETLLEAQQLREAINGDRTNAIDISLIKKSLQDSMQFITPNQNVPTEIDSTTVPVNYNSVIGDYQTAFARLKTETKSATQASEKANKENQQASDDHVRAIKAKTDVIDKLRSDISKLRRKVEDLDSDKALIENRYTKQITEKDDELTQLDIRYQRYKQLASSQIETLNNTITMLKLKAVPVIDIAKAPAQGEILRVANRNTAFINLGRRDFVRPGLKFSVYEKKGLKRHEKGEIEINSIKDTWSQVTILKENNELDPIVRLDKIWSPFYKKGQKPNFVFLGEKLNTPLMTLDYMRKQLQALGATVSDEVDVSTDYAIALSGYKQDPNFDKVRQFGVMILSEKDILPYVLP